MNKETLRMERVTYVEHGVALLQNFNFQLFTGEIMGLVAVDSYGIDAFIQLLQANKQIRFGHVYIKEKLVNSYHRSVHTRNNVCIISNENSLVGELSVAENIFVLRKGYRGKIVKNKVMQQQMQRLLSELGVEIEPDIMPKQLTLFQRYVIEIVKAVISMPDIIVVKDPSSVINQNDIPHLHRIIQFYAKQGYTFIYISVYRDELLQVCDRISMMSNGHIVKVTNKDELSEKLMSFFAFSQLPEKRGGCNSRKEDEAVFWCRKLYYRNIRGLSFSVNRRECFIIHDYDNAICNDFVQVIMENHPENGEIYWIGKWKWGKRYRRRVAVILENPAETMLFNSMSYEDNICFAMDHRLAGLWRRKRLRAKIAEAFLCEDLPEPTRQLQYLTLQQKYALVYGRVFMQRPDVVFCIHPFLNVDMGMREYIQSLFGILLEHGIAVVILTVNYKDALSFGNRLMVVKNGKEELILSRDEFMRFSEEENLDGG